MSLDAAASKVNEHCTKLDTKFLETLYINHNQGKSIKEIKDTIYLEDAFIAL